MPVTKIRSQVLRDVREIIVRERFGRADLTVDPITAAALALNLPVAAGITVVQSGLIIIGPIDRLRVCRDPLEF